MTLEIITPPQVIRELGKWLDQNGELATQVRIVRSYGTVPVQYDVDVRYVDGGLVQLQVYKTLTNPDWKVKVV